MRWWLVVYGEGNRNTDKTTDHIMAISFIGDEN
jgi:hypothetical protein